MNTHYVPLPYIWYKVPETYVSLVHVSVIFGSISLAKSPLYDYCTHCWFLVQCWYWVVLDVPQRAVLNVFLQI